MEEKVQCTGWFGPCENEGTKQRQNTQYEDDESNWVTLCPECMAECDSYWKERWAEVYSSRF